MNLTQTNTKTSISIDDMIKELNYFNYDLTGMSNEEIKTSFYKHASENLEEIEIQDLYKNKHDNEVLIESPDGLQTLGFYVAKSKRTCYYLETENESNIKCSLDHFVETINGFQKTENLTLDDIILTKDGYSKLTIKNNIGESIVFDFEVEHQNERYYNTNGISNHNTGKTFLCLNFAKAAQKQDYYVIYLDSENAIDLNLCNKFGIDTSKFRIDPIATVEDLKVYLAKFIKKMQDMKDEGYELPKVLLVLDSLGNLASNKEVNDAETGSEKSDMTRAKQLKSIFRIVTQKLGMLGIPLVLSNHSYFCLASNSMVVMKDGNSREIKDIIIGDYVQTLDGPKEVEEIYSFDNAPTLKIELEDGKIIECTPNHKFLVKPEWSNDETDECWKEAEELKSGDIILSMDLVSELA